MKLIIATAALVTLVATPALAQYRDRADDWRSSEAYRSYGLAPDAGAAYARPYASDYYGSGARSPNPAFDVFDTRGRYVGSDPDPRVRSELARDPAYGD
jgi:hypothetical protein